MIDLHIHSEFSIDSKDTPESILTHAAELGIRAVSLTEHGNVSSLGRAKKEAARLGLEYVNGVELGTALEIGGALMDKIHITGYFFADACPNLKKLSAQARSKSQIQAKAFISGLRELDIPVTRELVENLYPGRFSTWAVRRILREQGYAADKPEAEQIQEKAFRAAAERDKSLKVEDTAIVGAEETIKLLKADGAVTFMAHPFWLTKASRGGFSENYVWKLIERMLDCGIDGLEAYNTGNDAGYAGAVLDFCRAEGLPASGGSDSHGKGDLGKKPADYSLLESMRRFRDGKPPWQG